jgi:peptidyl-prolyl cis-trans isomerase C
MLSLDKGQISQEPILSSFGYHIVELIDVRDASFPTYDELADEIRKDLITQTRDDLISALRNSAKIETFE